jgi:hypothetical protein
LLTRTRRRARNEPLPAHAGGRPARAGSSAVNALAPAPPAPPTNAPRSRPPLPDSSPPQQQLPPLRLLVGPSGPSACPLRPTASNWGGVRPSVRWNASPAAIAALPDGVLLFCLCCRWPRLPMPPEDPRTRSRSSALTRCGGPWPVFACDNLRTRLLYN